MKKIRRISRKNPNTRRYRLQTPTQRLFRLIEDRLTQTMYSVKTFKEYRTKLKSIVNDDEYWKGIENIGKLVIKLKFSMDDLG